MIEFIYATGYGHAPIFMCDVCGEPVDEPDDIALCVLDSTGEVTDVIHCHRGPCVHETEAKHANVAWLSMRRFLQHLTRSIGVPVDLSDSEEKGLPRSQPLQLQRPDQQRSESFARLT